MFVFMLCVFLHKNHLSIKISFGNTSTFALPVNILTPLLPFNLVFIQIPKLNPNDITSCVSERRLGQTSTN